LFKLCDVLNENLVQYIYISNVMGLLIGVRELCCVAEENASIHVACLNNNSFR